MGDLRGKNKALSLAQQDRNKIIEARTGSTEEKQASVYYFLAENKREKVTEDINISA